VVNRIKQWFKKIVAFFGGKPKDDSRIPAYTGERPEVQDRGMSIHIRHGNGAWDQHPDGWFYSGFERWFDEAARRGMGKRLHNAGGRSCENQRILKSETRILSTFDGKFVEGVWIPVLVNGVQTHVADKIGYVWTVSGGFRVEFEYTHKGDTLVRGQYTITDTQTGVRVTGNGQRDGNQPSRVKWNVDGQLYAESIRWNYIANGNQADMAPGPWVK